MPENKKKIQAHFVKYKDRYIGAAIGAGVVAVGSIGLKKLPRPEIKISPEIIQILSWKPQATQNVIVEVVERSTPSKPVILKGTQQVFDSINEAARKTGHSRSAISNVVNGISPHVKGDVFEFATKAA